MKFLPRHAIALLLAAVCVFATHAAVQDVSKKNFTVVIDPGHGGKDYGCIGALTNEKTIVLDVSKRLGEMIKQSHPEVDVLYTRDSDRFIALGERAAIANRADADLFISVHVNSVDRRNRNRKKISGAQVYTLGLHRSDDNLAVAMRENAVIELEEDFSETYQGFDPNSSESYIIFELTQNRHMQQSIELADAIQRELITTANRDDKGVRQSGFLVLRATGMPAVLVELDFICNPSCERFLDSDDGKAKCASAIYNAFDEYYKRQTRRSGATPATTDESPQAESRKSATPVTYHVQFLTSVTQVATDDASLQVDAPQVTYYFENNTYKYITGGCRTLAQAKKVLRGVKKSHPEAFIIKMRDGRRIE